MDISPSLDPTEGPVGLVVLRLALWGACGGFHPVFVGSEGGNATWHRPPGTEILQAGAPRAFQDEVPLVFRFLAAPHGDSLKIETRVTHRGQAGGGWDPVSQPFHDAFLRAVARHPSGHHRTATDAEGRKVRAFFPDPVGTFRGGRFVFHMRFEAGAPSAHQQMRWNQDIASLLDAWGLPTDLATADLPGFEDI